LFISNGNCVDGPEDTCDGVGLRARESADRLERGLDENVLLRRRFEECKGEREREREREREQTPSEATDGDREREREREQSPSEATDGDRDRDRDLEREGEPTPSE
jgi:hypothetical protein